MAAVPGFAQCFGRARVSAPSRRRLFHKTPELKWPGRSKLVKMYTKYKLCIYNLRLPLLQLPLDIGATLPLTTRRPHCHKENLQLELFYLQFPPTRYGPTSSPISISIACAAPTQPHRKPAFWYGKLFSDCTLIPPPAHPPPHTNTKRQLNSPGSSPTWRFFRCAQTFISGREEC
jgi:hypothetical protein